MSRQVRRRSALFARFIALAAAAGGLSAGALIALTGQALAQPLPSQCAQSGTIETCTFTAQGETLFTVPQNVSSITATAVGASGGTALFSSPSPGLGAVAKGTIAVTPGESLYLEIDVLGGAAGRESFLVDAGAGGGESDVRTCSSSGSCASGTTLASRLLVAGGGGGAGDFGGAGGNAGTTGDAGNGGQGTLGFAFAGGGGGATTTGPGGGGASCGDGGSDGSPGASAGGAGGAGGNANTNTGPSGGGGGAGWFGGGGGGGCASPVNCGGSGGGGTSGAASSVTSTSFTQATSSEAPSVTLTFTAPFEVTTSFLPNGLVDSSYDQTLAAANGTTPYTWQLDGGSLPDGLSLGSSGTISGTPTEGGTFTFTVEATDAAKPAENATEQLSISVATVSTNTVVIPTSANSTFGAGENFLALVMSDNGTKVSSGLVQFVVDGANFRSPVAVSAGGTANSGLVFDLSVGTHTVTADYLGSSVYSPSSDSTTVTVGQATPEVSLAADPSSNATVADSVTLTATVTSPAPVTGPTGSVAFTVNGSPASCGSVTISGSQAQCTLGNLAGDATYSFGASYSGDTNYTMASASITGYQVSQVTPGMTLAASPSSGATVITPVTLTATLSGVAGVSVPTGSVDFTVNGSPASCGSITITGSQAQCSLGDLPSGIYSFGASYGGDSNYFTTAAALTGYSVSLLTTSEIITPADSSSAYGSPVTFTATITTGGNPVDGGTVQWLVDGTDSGSPVTVGSDGTVTLGPLADLPVGSDTVEADYSGSAQDAATTDQTQITVGQAFPAVELAASPTSGATVDTPVTLTATIVGAAGAAAPTGSVSFRVEGSSLSCTSVTVSGSQAQCALGDLPAGTYTLVASYSGDTNYQGASGLVTGYQVSLLTTAETITPSVPSPVFGQPVGFSATVSSGGSPVTGGSVQWLVDGTMSGSPAPVSASGSAALGPISDLGVGMHTIEADYSGTSTYAATTQQYTIVVGKAATTTTVKATRSALYATVTAVAPGAGTPTGTVTFAVNGTNVGTVSLPASGTATLSYKLPGAAAISASYSGDASFTGSSVSTATKNPTITARVTSKFGKTKFGWYRSAVTVTFTCKPGSAPLSGPCPGPVTLRRNGAGQSVSRTIHGQDGGIATVVVSPINIDQVPPKVTVSGVRNGATYDAPGPARIACTATDRLSGLVGPCKLVIHRSETTVTWIATATDRAGDTETTRGEAHLLDYFVAGAARVSFRYVVKVGQTYTVEAYILSAQTAPEYVFAAPDGQEPHPVGPAMTKIGPHLWAIRVAVTPAMDTRYGNWALGVLSGGTLHKILLTLRR
jgi:hypothetical protein